MAQHFLLSAAARSLSIGKVMRMSDHGAENVFMRLRWPATDGEPVCPQCDGASCYDCHRGDQRRWRCKACCRDFSVTSGTLFAWHKLPLKTYLLAIVPLGHRGVLQRGEGQEHARLRSGSRCPVQDSLCAGA